MKTKETIGPIADGDVMAYDDDNAANNINNYFSSVFTNAKLPIPEPVPIVNGCPTDRLTDISFRKSDVFK